MGNEDSREAWTNLDWGNWEDMLLVHVTKEMALSIADSKKMVHLADPKSLR